MNGLNFNYDGNFLVVEISNEIEIINYQLEMLIHNDINFLLPARKQIKNDKLYIYYDVSSKVSLDVGLARQKMADVNFIEFIKNLMNAFREIEDYQLVQKGILIDNKFIFINPVTFEPGFVYLPLYKSGKNMPEALAYFKNMIVSDMIEISNTGVMQKMISILNGNYATPLELIEVLENLTRAGGQQSNIVNNNAMPKANIEPNMANNVYAPINNNVGNLYEERQNINIQNNIPQNNIPQNNIPQNNIPQNNIPQNNIPTFNQQRRNVEQEMPSQEKMALKPKNIPLQKPTAKNSSPKEKNKENENKGGKIGEKKRTIMLAVGAGIIILFAALFANGMFDDENGETDYSVLIAVPILIGVAEYVVYKKVGVSEEKNTENKAKADKNNGKEILIKKKELKSEKNTSKKFAGGNIPNSNPMGNIAGGEPRYNDGGQMPINQNMGMPAQPNMQMSFNQNMGMPAQPNMQMPFNQNAGMPAQPNMQMPFNQNMGMPAQPNMQMPFNQNMGMSAQPNMQMSNNYNNMGGDKTEIFDDAERQSYVFLEGMKGNRIVIQKEVTRVGKLSDKVDIIIDNPKVSRIHADLIYRNGCLYVLDLSSANGTYVNSKDNRISTNVEYLLNNNDRVIFANEEFIVHI